MKSQFIVLIVALAQGIAAVALSGPPPTPGHPLTNAELASVRVAASNSLATFRRHITPSNYELMGFNTATEILTATNGEPLRSFAVPFFNLTNYNGGDFAQLLKPQPQTQLRSGVIVPVMAGTNVRSSLTLRSEQGQAMPGLAETPTRWLEGDWGHPKVIRNLIGTYRAATNTTDVRQGTVPFAVEIPIPRIWLVGYFNKQDKLVLRSTTDLHIGTNTINRSEVIADAAMQQLTTEARRYNPALPN